MPKIALDTSGLFIHPLYADETINIIWKWEFYDNGQPQNDAFGDILSFSINYTINEMAFLPEKGGGGSVVGGDGPERPVRHQLRVDVLGSVTTAWVTPDGKLFEPLIASDFDNQCRLAFLKGTQITGMGNGVVDELVVNIYQEPLLLPQGSEIVGPVYQLSGLDNGTPVPSIVFSPPITVTLDYNHDLLPENTLSLSIAAYSEKSGWQYLEQVDNAGESGKISVLLSYPAILAVLAEVTPEQPVPDDQKAPDRGSAPPLPPPANYSPPPSTGRGDDITKSPQNIDTKTVARLETGILETLKWTSLSVAISGVIAMAVLAGIERKRRIQIQN